MGIYGLTYSLYHPRGDCVGTKIIGIGNLQFSFFVLPYTDGNETVATKEKGSSEVRSRTVDKGNLVWHGGVN